MQPLPGFLPHSGGHVVHRFFQIRGRMGPGKEIAADRLPL